VKEKLYNGKPISHWENVARDIVVSALVRAGSMYEKSPISDAECIPHTIAHKQLMNLAKGISEPLFNKAIEERDRCRRNLSVVVSSLKTGSKKRKSSPPKKA
jgi:hypothetical protein